MKFNEAITLREARGSGSFDYRYWFWAKKASSYGVGYARQNIQLDVSRKGNEALDALENIKDVLSTLKKEDGEPDFEVVERKVKTNTKRITGIADLFNSPIVINWLTGQPPTVIRIPKGRPDDVTDLDGKRINVVKIFGDPATRELVTDVMDWDKVIINDKEGDTLNTVIAKFITTVFQSGSQKNMRKVARGSGLEGVMSSLRFKDKGIEVVPFKKEDYKIVPAEVIGSKKVPSELQTTIKEKFPQVLKRARSAF